jgi:acyl-CoA synthetase (AMP-forming)/AMP-acid ligase II
VTDTLVALLGQRAAQVPDACPVVATAAGQPDKGLTYAELASLTAQVAGYLADRVPPGGRVLLAARAGAQFAAWFFGCLAAGVVPVPVPPPRPGTLAGRYQYIAGSAGAELTLTADDWAGMFSTHASGEVVTLRDTAGASAMPRRPGPVPDDVAWIQCTAGTTGPPKLVPVTHAAAVANLAQIAAMFGGRLGPGDLAASWLPYWHDMGLVTGLLAPVYGAWSVLITQPEDFVADPAGWLSRVAERRCVTASLPGFAYDLLRRRVPAEQRPRLDLTGWKYAMCGADVIDPAVLREFAVAFKPSGFSSRALYAGYGLGEAVVLAAAGEPGTGLTVVAADPEGLAAGRLTARTGGIPLVAAGRPAAGVSLHVVTRDDQRPCPPGGVGEIAIAGPNVATGYCDGFAAPTVPVGGRVHLLTGDLGAVVGGQLFVLGRLADLIEVGGLWYYPAFLERDAAAAVPGLSATRTAAVQLDGEVIIVAERGQDTDTAAAPAVIGETLARLYGLKVDRVVLKRRGWLPHTTSHKLIRHEVPDLLARDELTGQVA